MKKLNTYILKQIFVGFLLVTFSLMSIIWLTQSLRFIDLITNKGIPFTTFITMTSLLMPRIFNILAPISLFAAVLFVYNRMLSDRELVVMKSAGISPWQCSIPAAFFGIFVCILCTYIYSYGIPYSEKAFSELQWKVKNNVSHLMFREGEFTSVRYGLTIFVSEHEKDGSISGILVNDERNPNLRVTLSAEKGRVVYVDNTPKVIMINGARQELNRKTGQFSSVSFARYSVDFGVKDNARKKAAGVRQKTLHELLSADQDPDLSPKDKRRHIVEGHRRLISPFYNILFALLACTGLLIGNFNRRGQIKIISVSVIMMVLIQAADLSITNLTAKHISLLPLMYANLIVPWIICLYLLRCYRPGLFHKRNKLKPEGINND